MAIDWGYRRQLNQDIAQQRSQVDATFAGLAQLLSSAYNQGIPDNILAQLRQGYETSLNRQYNNAREGIEQNIAGSGLRNSGVLSAMLAELYGKKAEAQTQYESNLAGQDLGFRRMALQDLLQLGQYRGGLTEQRASGDRSEFQFFQNLNEKARQFNTQADAYNDANAWYNTILPSLIQAGAKIGAAAIL